MQERYCGKAGPRCPGESQCDLWRDAADVDDLNSQGERIGRNHVCMGCELLPTKPKQRPETDDLEAAEALQEVEYLADTQAAGFRLKAKDLEPLHYELLILWARYREAAQQEQQQSLFLLLATPRL